MNFDKLASRQPTQRPGAPSASPDSVPVFSPTARSLPLRRAKLTDVLYNPTVPRPNSPAIIVKSNALDSSRLSRRGTALAFALYAVSHTSYAQLAATPASLSSFSTTVGNASLAQSLTLNATGPLGAIAVTAPAGFEVSKNATSGFASSITLGVLGGGIQSVYRGNFAIHAGTVWSNGNGAEFPNSGAFAAITSNGIATWGDPSSGGTSASLPSNISAIYSNEQAFAAIKNDGSVVTWGLAFTGGNSTSVSAKLSGNVTIISSTSLAFAAIKNDGSVVTWGLAMAGGNATATFSSSVNGSYTEYEVQSVANLLNSSVTRIYSNESAFAALKENGSVVTWGYIASGGNSSVAWWPSDSVVEVRSRASSLTSNVSSIFSNAYAFSALKGDGSVVAWGDLGSGGNATVTSALDVHGNWTVTEGASVEGNLGSNVAFVYSSGTAFAALKKNGSVVTWGDRQAGGNSSVVTFLDGLDENGLAHDSLVEGSSVAGLLNSNVVTIYSNRKAFAALKDNGSVVTWGNRQAGGNSSAVISSFANGNQTITESASAASSLSSGVVSISSNEYAFAALKENGSVVTWGDVYSGGNATVTTSTESGDSNTYNSTISEIKSVSNSLSSNVTAIYSNGKAFAALKNDGSVVAWGAISSGGNLTQYNVNEGASVANTLSSGVIAIYSTRDSFSALKEDGSIVYWGTAYPNPVPANIGASTKGLPANIYVRLASPGTAQAVSGDLVFSSLTGADDVGIEIDRLPLSGVVSSGSSGSSSGSNSNSGSGSGSSGSSGGSSSKSSSAAKKGKQAKKAKQAVTKKKSSAPKKSKNTKKK